MQKFHNCTQSKQVSILSPIGDNFAICGVCEVLKMSTVVDIFGKCCRSASHLLKFQPRAYLLAELILFDRYGLQIDTGSSDVLMP